MTIDIYGDEVSGNCLKVMWTAELLDIPYRWHTIDVVAGESRTAEFLAINPQGKVPFLITKGGEKISESGAIISFLAANSRLIPTDPVDHAHMLQWMFWEQYSHEPYIAVRRFHLALARKTEAELDPKLKDCGERALATMEEHMAGRDFFVGERLTLADIALVAYTRMAGEGGFDLSHYPAIQSWIDRCEAELGLD